MTVIAKDKPGFILVGLLPVWFTLSVVVLVWSAVAGSSDGAREVPPAGRLALWRHVAAACRHCRPTADQTGKPRQMVLVGHPEFG